MSYSRLESVGHGLVEHAVEVAAVAPGHAGRPDDVLQHEVPPDDEGDQLPHRRVAV